MTREDIFKTVDHTLLAQTATWEEIKEICDDAIKYQTASVCIPASYVKRAKDYVDGKMAICTVIGFPNGYSTTAVKEYETKDAILNGADEIDMVINIAALKNEITMVASLKNQSYSEVERILDQNFSKLIKK